MTSQFRHRSVEWERIVGLRVIAFVYREQDQPESPRRDWSGRQSRAALPRPAEVTGIEDDYLYVVLDDEDEPRKVFWTDVRPR